MANYSVYMEQTLTTNARDARRPVPFVARKSRPQVSERQFVGRLFDGFFSIDTFLNFV